MTIKYTDSQKIVQLFHLLNRLKVTNNLSISVFVYSCPINTLGCLSAVQLQSPETVTISIDRR